MTNISNTKTNEVYNELKEIIYFLKDKGYGSTVLYLHYTINTKAVCELLKQDGLEVRQNGKTGLHIIWDDVTNMCIYGLDISMAPSKNIIQNLEFQYLDEYQ